MSTGIIASQAFVPNKFAGLLMWLDASDLATVTPPAGDVTTWADKSGGGKDLLAGLGARVPQSGVATINGKNVITFNGADDHLTFDGTLGISGSDAGTIFLITRIPFVSFGRTALYFGVNDGTAGQMKALDINTQTGVPTVNENSGYRFNNGNLLFAGDNWGTFPNVSAWTWLDGAIYAAHQLYVNGVLQTVLSSSNPGSVPAVVDEQVVLGAQAAGTGNSLFYLGDIGEVIIYDRALSSFERQIVEKYLGNKWNISVTSFPQVFVPAYVPAFV